MRTTRANRSSFRDLRNVLAGTITAAVLFSGFAMAGDVAPALNRMRRLPPPHQIGKPGGISRTAWLAPVKYVDPPSFESIGDETIVEPTTPSKPIAPAPITATPEAPKLRVPKPDASDPTTPTHATSATPANSAGQAIQAEVDPQSGQYSYPTTAATRPRLLQFQASDEWNVTRTPLMEGQIGVEVQPRIARSPGGHAKLNLNATAIPIKPNPKLVNLPATPAAETIPAAEKPAAVVGIPTPPFAAPGKLAEHPVVRAIKPFKPNPTLANLPATPAVETFPAAENPAELASIPSNLAAAPDEPVEQPVVRAIKPNTVNAVVANGNPPAQATLKTTPAVAPSRKVAPSLLITKADTRTTPGVTKVSSPRKPAPVLTAARANPTPATDHMVATPIASPVAAKQADSATPVYSLPKVSPAPIAPSPETPAFSRTTTLSSVGTEFMDTSASNVSIGPSPYAATGFGDNSFQSIGSDVLFRRSIVEPDWSRVFNTGCNQCSSNVCCCREAVWSASAGVIAMHRSHSDGFDAFLAQCDVTNEGVRGRDMDLDFAWGPRVAITRNNLCGGLDFEGIFYQIEEFSGSNSHVGDLIIREVNFIGVGTSFVDYESQITNVEFNASRWLNNWTKLLLGARWIQLDEKGSITASTATDPNYRDQVDIENSIVGGQLGIQHLMWDRGNGFTITGTLKGGVFLNNASRETIGFGTSPLSDDTTSLLGEIDINANYQWSDRWAFNAGYQFLAISDAGLALDQFFSPNAIFYDDVMLQGFRLGITYTH